MALRYDAFAKNEGLNLLRHCYKFVQTDWPRLPREALPDQGFEIHFRRSCTITLKDWQISEEWELGFGSGLMPASGVRHEIDFVAHHPDLLVVGELKNKAGRPPGKNDVIVFFAKILDYLSRNPKILLKEVLPIFISNFSFEESALATCLGLGIHPIAPDMRPLPVLGDTLKRIEIQIAKGSALPEKVMNAWEDTCSIFNRLVLGLDETWLSARCGYMSDQIMTIRTTTDVESLDLSRELRRANSDCSKILGAIRSKNE